MNRYLLVTLVAVVAIFLTRAQKFKILSSDAIDDDRLERAFANTDKKVLLYFWQPNCRPCDDTTPLLEDLVREYSKKLFLVKIDTSNPDNKAVHDQYGITQIPTIVVVQNGKVQTQWIGPFHDRSLMLRFIRPSGSY